MASGKYILKEDELISLVNEVKNNGPEKTYDKLKEKINLVVDFDDNLDSMLMDMHDSVLQRARICAEDDKNIDTLYSITVILRRLAHQIHRAYIKRGKDKSNNNFLHVA